jgi:5-hydroxyisourate hydrolase-like protein (transthyretin family)
MTNEQESHLNMQQTTVGFCDNNSSEGLTIPAYSSNLEMLSQINVQIQGIAGAQETGTTGITANKKQIRTNVNLLASDTARKLTSFAKLTDNHILLGEINYSESDFRNFSDNEARDKGQIVYNKAQEYITELPIYGINEETQIALQASLNLFRGVIVAPRLSATAKKQATVQLGVLFKTAAALLEKIDAAVELVKLTDPIFYTGYKSARKVISKGSGKLAVKGIVSDTQSGEPVKGVIITFMHDGAMTLTEQSTNRQPVVTKTSAAKGGFTIKSMPAGIYRVSFKKMGYAEQVVTVNVNDGELTTVEVELSKI